MILPYRFWCQKVLPTIYDDSLSYYEVLNKMGIKLNEVINAVNSYSGGGGNVNNIFHCVADMQVAPDIKKGMILFTTGYYTDGDCGACVYVAYDEEVDFSIEMVNGLYAVPVASDIITPEMFGAKGDYQDANHVGTDDTLAIETAIAYAAARKAKIVLNHRYFTTNGIEIPSSCSGIEIQGNSGNNYFNGFYGVGSAVVKQYAQHILYRNMAISCASTSTGGNGLTIGLHILTSVDDHMTFLDGVQFRYLNIGVKMYGNSVEVNDCHFSMCNYGVYVENAGFDSNKTPYYSSYEFKSLTIYGTRFHGCPCCVYVDKTIPAESWANGVTIASCYGDKCGVIYEGTCYNVHFSANCFTKSRSSGSSADLGMIILEGWTNADNPSQPPTVNPSARCNSSFLANNFINGATLASGGGVIYIKDSTRVINISGNTFYSGGGDNFVVGVNTGSVNIINNTCLSNGISFDADSSVITIDGNIATSNSLQTISADNPANRIGTNIGFAE